ncbi:septation protein SepH [Humibacter albus]|uniref:septation protein SepH n=1 Tax=Humibacter albus TaxID=427754 RepID=UPI0003B664EB|nr:septation protein SepH [Humibacter albus]
MQDLKVIGVENGALLAANGNGERFRIAIDEMLQSRLRQIKPEPVTGPKVSPREIQAHIRSGLSAEEVAELTGAAIGYVERFESPIVAEREHIVASALSVPVRTGADIDPLSEGDTFGSVIRERLVSVGATGERWTSWKEPEGGWIVKLTFVADDVDHDARWTFEPRKLALAPSNADAHTLSQQGELQTGLIPRLRAVTPVLPVPDDSRFDSGAFTLDESSAAPGRPDASVSRAPQNVNNAVSIQAIKRAADDEPRDVHQTADLLEALRKRRGEREAAGLRDSAPQAVDVPLDTFDDPGAADGDPTPATLPQASAEPAGSERQAAERPNSTGPVRGRRGRKSMPSWDEIVFGARTDDDLA